MTKWEYTFEYGDSEFGFVMKYKEFDDLGKRGWELVTTHRLRDHYTGEEQFEAIFKRPISEDEDSEADTKPEMKPEPKPEPEPEEEDEEEEEEEEKKIVSKESSATWTFITPDVEDEWSFYNPYISDDVLYIECDDVVFGTAMEWRDRNNEGSAAGTASINDTFDKVVPFRVEYEKRKTEANEPQSFTIIVPLSDLDVSQPTNMYFRAGITANGKEKNLIFDFSMTW